MGYGYGSTKTDGSFPVKYGVIAGAVVIALILLSILWAMTSEKVVAGTHCVERENGRASEVHGPGRVWLTPFFDDLKCYETTEQSLEFTSQESDADFTDTYITHQSKDGVQIAVAGMVTFQLQPERLIDIQNNYGGSMAVYVEKRMQAYVREVVRSEIESMTITELYPGGTAKLSSSVEQKIAPVLEERGVTVTNFVVSAIDPGGDYKAAIEAQQQQVQAQELAVEEQKTAAEQAKVKETQAQGEANAAIAKAQGDAESKKVQAEADAYVITTRADAKAYENTQIAESMTPELVQLAYYEALKSANWAIFSPDEVMPTMPITTPEAGE